MPCPMIVITGLILGAVLGWRRAAKRGGNRADKLQYAAAHGMALAVLGITYFMIWDWPMNIGGKPSQALYKNLPAFVPVMFEFTVLCAAHGMAITYLIRNKTLPGMPARNPDPRSTDDKFIIEVRTADNHGHSSEAITDLLRTTPVFEINERQY